MTDNTNYNQISVPPTKFFRRLTKFLATKLTKCVGLGILPTSKNLVTSPYREFGACTIPIVAHHLGIELWLLTWLRHVLSQIFNIHIYALYIYTWIFVERLTRTVMPWILSLSISKVFRPTTYPMLALEFPRLTNFSKKILYRPFRRPHQTIEETPSRAQHGCWPKLFHRVSSNRGLFARSCSKIGVCALVSVWSHYQWETPSKSHCLPWTTSSHKEKDTQETSSVSFWMIK